MEMLLEYDEQETYETSSSVQEQQQQQQQQQQHQHQQEHQHQHQHQQHQKEYILDTETPSSNEEHKDVDELMNEAEDIKQQKKTRYMGFQDESSPSTSSATNSKPAKKKFELMIAANLQNNDEALDSLYKKFYENERQMAKDKMEQIKTPSFFENAKNCLSNARNVIVNFFSPGKRNNTTQSPLKQQAATKRRFCPPATDNNLPSDAYFKNILATIELRDELGLQHLLEDIESWKINPSLDYMKDYIRQIEREARIAMASATTASSSSSTTTPAAIQSSYLSNLNPDAEEIREKLEQYLLIKETIPLQDETNLLTLLSIIETWKEEAGQNQQLLNGIKEVQIEAIDALKAKLTPTTTESSLIEDGGANNQILTTPKAHDSKQPITSTPNNNNLPLPPTPELSQINSAEPIQQFNSGESVAPISSISPPTPTPTIPAFTPTTTSGAETKAKKNQLEPNAGEAALTKSKLPNQRQRQQQPVYRRPRRAMGNRNHSPLQRSEPVLDEAVMNDGIEAEAAAAATLSAEPNSPATVTSSGNEESQASSSETASANRGVPTEAEATTTQPQTMNNWPAVRGITRFRKPTEFYYMNGEASRAFSFKEQRNVKCIRCNTTQTWQLNDGFTRFVTNPNLNHHHTCQPLQVDEIVKDQIYRKHIARAYAGKDALVCYNQYLEELRSYFDLRVLFPPPVRMKRAKENFTKAGKKKARRSFSRNRRTSTGYLEKLANAIISVYAHRLDSSNHTTSTLNEAMEVDFVQAEIDENQNSEHEDDIENSEDEDDQNMQNSMQMLDLNLQDGCGNTSDNGEDKDTPPSSLKSVESVIPPPKFKPGFLTVRRRGTRVQLPPIEIPEDTDPDNGSFIHKVGPDIPEIVKKAKDALKKTPAAPPKSILTSGKNPSSKQNVKFTGKETEHEIGCDTVGKELKKFERRNKTI